MQVQKQKQTKLLSQKAVLLPATYTMSLVMSIFHGLPPVAEATGKFEETRYTYRCNDLFRFCVQNRGELFSHRASKTTVNSDESSSLEWSFQSIFRARACKPQVALKWAKRGTNMTLWICISCMDRSSCVRAHMHGTGPESSAYFNECRSPVKQNNSQSCMLFSCTHAGKPTVRLSQAQRFPMFVMGEYHTLSRGRVSG